MDDSQDGPRTSPLIALIAVLLGSVVGAGGTLVATERTISATTRQQTDSDLRDFRRGAYLDLLRANEELLKRELKILDCLYEDPAAMDYAGDPRSLAFEIEDTLFPVYLDATGVASLVGTSDVVGALSAATRNHEEMISSLWTGPDDLRGSLILKVQQDHTSLLNKMREDIGVEGVEPAVSVGRIECVEHRNPGLAPPGD